MDTPPETNTNGNHNYNLNERKLEINDALNDAYHVYADKNPEDRIEEESFVEDTRKALRGLKDASCAAFKAMGGALEINLMMYILQEPRIYALDEIQLLPFDCDGNQLDVNPLKVDPKGFVREGWPSYCSLQINPYATDFPIAFAADFSGFEDRWHIPENRSKIFRFYPRRPPDANGDIKNDSEFIELRREFTDKLCALAEFIRTRGLEILSGFHAKRLSSFMRVTRHELLQKTDAMNTLTKKFISFLNDDQPVLHKPDMSIEYATWPTDNKKYHALASKIREYILTTQSYAYSTAIHATAGRYINGVHNPVMRKFQPYHEFMFKWAGVFRDECSSRRIETSSISIDKNDKNRPYMLADPSQIEQVVYNLMLNAIKYSYRYTCVDYDFKLDESRRNYVFRITNYGPMIPKADEERIFGYGYRTEAAHNEPDRDKSGDGLGLFISRQIAEQHKYIRRLSDGTKKEEHGTLKLVENKHICDYNLPMLALIDIIPEAWKKDGRLYNYRQPHWKIEENELIAKGQLLEQGSLEKIVNRDIVNALRDQRAGARESSMKKMVADMWGDAWMSIYWDELSKPTARITFELSVPYGKEKYLYEKK